jgi:hypothetical protein
VTARPGAVKLGAVAAGITGMVRMLLAGYDA